MSMTSWRPGPPCRPAHPEATAPSWAARRQSSSSRGSRSRHVASPHVPHAVPRSPCPPHALPQPGPLPRLLLLRGEVLPSLACSPAVKRHLPLLSRARRSSEPPLPPPWSSNPHAPSHPSSSSSTAPRTYWGHTRRPFAFPGRVLAGVGLLAAAAPLHRWAPTSAAPLPWPSIGIEPRWAPSHPPPISGRPRPPDRRNPAIPAGGPPLGTQLLRLLSF
jgi:hypothetical protein